MTERTPGFWLGGAALVVVLAAIIAGLFVIGGPGEARLERLDTERTEDLRRIERAVDEVWRRTETLPPSLDSLPAANRLTPDDLIDPTTGALYDYRVLSDSTYELCATFDLANDDAPAPFTESDVTPGHDAGRHCFTLHPLSER